MTYTASQFYADEQNRLTEKTKNAEAILNTNQRLATLNDSYRKRYSRYLNILMVLILAYGIYLACILLQRSFAISQFIVDVVIVVLIFSVAFYLFRVIWELNSRSVINYDELDIPSYDKNEVIKGDEKILSGDDSWGVSGCMNNDCCPTGYHYDSTSNICILDGSTPSPSQRSSFTTLEYENINSAYDYKNLNNENLRREPNENVVPLQHVTVLSFSEA
jgi:hypothetical protein